MRLARSLASSYVDKAILGHKGARARRAAAAAADAEGAQTVRERK